MRSDDRFNLLVAVWAFLALLLPTGVFAQKWPAKPVHIIVPFGTGGGTDIQARVLASAFHEQSGQSFVIENHPGATGLIGAEIAARSPPDGYTILFTTASITANTTLYGKRMKTDPVKDLAPISWLTSTPLVLVVHPSVPATSVKELVALARARPNFLNAGINAPGSMNHLAAEMLKQKAGIATVFIPYKGGGPAITALMSGEIDYNFCTGPVASVNLRTHRIRALAVTTTKRASAFPNLPTMNTFYPGFEIDNWYAMWFPAGTRRGIVAKMNEIIVKSMRSKRVHDFMKTEGLDPVASSSELLGAHVKTEIAKYAKVIRKGNIRLQ